MRVQDDNSLALIQHGEERVEFGRAEVLALHIRCQLDAICLQGVECIDGFADGGINIGQG